MQNVDSFNFSTAVSLQFSVFYSVSVQSYWPSYSLETYEKKSFYGCDFVQGAVIAGPSKTDLTLRIGSIVRTDRNIMVKQVINQAIQCVPSDKPIIFITSLRRCSFSYTMLITFMATVKIQASTMNKGNPREIA